MRVQRVIVAILLLHTLLAPLFAQESDAQPYFSLTSERTYLPGEKVEVAVYSHNVSALQFRVYRVNDPIKFFGQLQEMHSFGGQAPRLPKQAHTWLERFHAWKHRIWAWVRDFIRTQFSPDSRHQIRLWRMQEAAPQKRGPQVDEYAQVPVLNQQQLVSTWKWMVPPGERWHSQNVTVPVNEKGVYLVEATEGTLRAYTIVVVTEIAVITKAAPGRLLTFVVDRHTGDPIAGAMTRFWIDHKEIASKQTDRQGLMDTAVTQDKPENVAVLVTYNDQFAVNTPGAWNLGSASDRNLRGYTYTDRPVYRPGDTVHFKTIVRAENPSGYTLPQRARSSPRVARSAHLSARLAADRETLRHGHGALGLRHPRRCQPRLLLPVHAVGRALRRGHALLRAGLQEARVRGESDCSDPARAAGTTDQGHDRRALLLWRAGCQRQGEVGGAHLDLLAIWTL